VRSHKQQVHCGMRRVSAHGIGTLCGAQIGAETGPGQERKDAAQQGYPMTVRNVAAHGPEMQWTMIERRLATHPIYGAGARRLSYADERRAVDRATYFLMPLRYLCPERIGITLTNQADVKCLTIDRDSSELAFSIHWQMLQNRLPEALFDDMLRYATVAIKDLTEVKGYYYARTPVETASRASIAHFAGNCLALVRYVDAAVTLADNGMMVDPDYLDTLVASAAHDEHAICDIAREHKELARAALHILKMQGQRHRLEGNEPRALSPSLPTAKLDSQDYENNCLISALHVLTGMSKAVVAGWLKDSVSRTDVQQRRVLLNMERALMAILGRVGFTLHTVTGAELLIRYQHNEGQEIFIDLAPFFRERRLLHAELRDQDKAAVRINAQTTTGALSLAPPPHLDIDLSQTDLSDAETGS
jgi:hypothetical protein